MLQKIKQYAKINNIPIMQKDGIDFLCNYIKENNIKTILEIGSAIGYSAIKMALVNKEIKVTTIEKDKTRYDIAITNINSLNLNNQITILNEDATISKIEDTFDLIFIDASKSNNINFFEKYKVNLSREGTIITDNLSFHGLVEDESLIKTRNQRGIVRKIKNYINYLDNNKDFTTTYVEVGDRISISKKIPINNKLIIAPSSQNTLEYLLNTDINYILIGLENYSITPSFKMDIEKIIELSKNTNKKIIISINKMMHNKDLNYINEVLIKLNNSLVDKVLFYDLSVLNIAKRINFSKDLIISLEHLNASSNSNNFYFKRGVNYSLITQDITYQEINEIAKTNMNIITTVYGYLPIFYSRRHLISNYLEYVKEPKESDKYYLKHNEDYYLINEQELGSVIYTKDKINLINHYHLLNNISNYLIDGSYISDNEFIEVLNSFINNIKVDNPYLGFFNSKTSYKVKKDE